MFPDEIDPFKLVNFLKQELQFKSLCWQILQQQAIENAASERGVTVTPEEIQAECDRLRLEKRLEKAADTLAWLAEQMVSTDDLEQGIHNRLLSQKLAEHLFARDVEKVFNQNKLNFDRLLLYQIVVDKPGLALELFYQIQDREISFFEAAYLYEIDDQRRKKCGCEGHIDRWSLHPELAIVAWSAKPGDVNRPIQTEQGFHLLRVEQFIPAQLTPDIYQEILNGMFQDWLMNEINYLLYNRSQVSA